MSVDRPAVEDAVRRLLLAIGEDPTRPGLIGTPDRVGRFWSEWIDFDPGKIETLFGADRYDQMVVLRGVSGWSLCEHHLLPFSFVATVAYIPNGQVLGLSKLARIVENAAHRLQLQEGMARDIAEHLAEVAKTDDVAVHLQGVHTCAVMRGVKAVGSEFLTTALRGAFKLNATTRAEFLGACRVGASLTP